MTWSYTADAVAAKDRVRDLIGDTDTTDQQLQDEQLVALVAGEPNEFMAGARAAGILAARYARQVDKSVGPFRLSLSQKSKGYRDLAVELVEASKARITSSPYAIPSAGGVSVAEKAAHAADATITQPDFKRGMHDHPGAPTPAQGF